MRNSKEKLQEVSHRAEEHYAKVNERYSKQTRQLVDMKTDLEYIHRKVRQDIDFLVLCCHPKLICACYLQWDETRVEESTVRCRS